MPIVSPEPVIREATASKKTKSDNGINSIKPNAKLIRNDNLTILITDHQARDLLVVCDRALILSNSKIVAEGTPNELIQNENATKHYFGDNFKFK